MKSILVQEQVRYTFTDLQVIFQSDEPSTATLIRRLREVDVIKVVRQSSFQRDLSVLNEDDVVIAEITNADSGFYYLFKYVGLVSISEWVVIVYPKYFLKTGYSHVKMHQVMRVIEKYGSDGQPLRIFDPDSQTWSLNLVPVMLFILRDYFEFGLYATRSDVVEINGHGQILWDKTIAGSYALLVEDQPIYFELQTAKSVEDTTDFFRRLHACVVTAVTEQLEAAGLLQIFELTPARISDESLSDMGDLEYVQYRLQRELSNEFNTRKQLVLKAIYAFVSGRTDSFSDGTLNLFGTSSFNLVWQEVCSQVLGNQMKTPLHQLGLLAEGIVHAPSNPTLLTVIERPEWHSVGKDGEFSIAAPGTLEPDILRVEHDDEGIVFYVLDAKYFVPTVTKESISGQPGVADVTKQYLYELAYRELLRNQKEPFRVVNSFLMPSDGDFVQADGYVTFGMLSRLGLSPIAVRLVPAERFYECYLGDQEMSLVDLEL
ncbi:LlaJI family restriction endonuclease [Mobiluncus curtisii]|uniref:LlaJI family restriction endonuclease n=1 Tax=Mobiluncus curtisii TaxID=2051 RepID=UPI0001E0BD24|nr:LlaJI family restriction endonuclease [Mobiluncus curtisii]EFL93601.1 LlaJI restriction endonuclease [Mobiluncus curtisii subsp. curtisii ATCC 35241]STY76347.1 LlaJI restriction endonuclease [Mobiluncus curtisii subsp. curtisii]